MLGAFYHSKFWLMRTVVKLNDFIRWYLTARFWICGISSYLASFSWICGVFFKRTNNWIFFRCIKWEISAFTRLYFIHFGLRSVCYIIFDGKSLHSWVIWLWKIFIVRKLCYFHELSCFSIFTKFLFGISSIDWVIKLFISIFRFIILFHWLRYIILWKWLITIIWHKYSLLTFWHIWTIFRSLFWWSSIIFWTIGRLQLFNWAFIRPWLDVIQI